MKKYNTVIWDMDGTLLNTLEDLTDSVNAALSKFGLPERTMAETRNFVGNGILRLVELSVPGGLNHPQFDEIFAAFKAHYGTNCNNKTQAYSGLVQLLGTLDKGGYKMAIVSNKIDSALKELAKLYFKDIVKVAIGESEGIRKKPSPDTVFEAMRILGADVESTVYVGDSDVDMATAKNAGIDCISVSWGFRTKEELISYGAKTIVDTPEDLEKYLSEHR